MSEWWFNEFYSQFGEDGVIFSFFRNKTFAKTGRAEDLDEGFYVDIGACHPRMLSNTWYFYQRGWRGINVEPTPGGKELFDEERPLDINLQLAVAAEAGDAALYSLGKGAVTNSLQPGWVDESQKTEVVMVKTLPLAQLLDTHLPEGRKISFLSVDVEGLDLVVLRSNDWDRYRPELVVVEHHQSDVRKILESELCGALEQWGYSLYGWTQPSLIFVRRR